MKISIKAFFCVSLSCFALSQTGYGHEFTFDITLQKGKSFKYPKSRIMHAIILNGFFIDPYDATRATFLNAKTNSIIIKPFFLNFDTDMSTRKEKLTLKIISKNKIWKYKIITTPYIFSFSLDYPREILWKKAKLFTRLPMNELQKIKNIMNLMLDSYKKDDLSSIIRYEKLKFRIQAERIACGKPDEQISYEMPFYKGAFHGANRERIHIERDFIVELNKENKRVVNVYQKNGFPILTLTSKYSLPFESKKNKYTEVNYFYNFIKIDGKWWIY